MIIAGGFNIYPRDIDEVLFQHPKVAEAVSLGVKDTYRGETVKAFVVLKEGESCTADEIIRFCKEKLAPYKVPKLVEFRESIPKSAVGKILRKVYGMKKRLKLNNSRNVTGFVRSRCGLKKPPQSLGPEGVLLYQQIMFCCSGGYSVMCCCFESCYNVFHCINYRVGEQRHQKGVKREGANNFRRVHLVILPLQADHDQSAHNQASQLKIREICRSCRRIFCESKGCRQKNNCCRRYDGS